ncbi:5-(carboxyamino)imidazole ribonucleotide mutase [Candidatus Velamenicoccus archaeovorus]|uniref:N5-carboxyaminoimidazole ribonucleotide mutase n=1 Tax=Velamenicoccus archaeovorus TaxID=1930593 RepID=A0A410P5U2_VELA1|nr:5-(carboxyamino)imidazole ribonucleotide mutase [Candidatus Velamenicoccus archaeovorus]QAT17520.1 5-(carboxyamino)imidazole ribonucleotide mutase [Candidatus Velamenicoccus archaeovorus]
MKKPEVAIVMGSVSDLETMQGAIDILKEFRVPIMAKVLSAHRTPKELEAFVVAMDHLGVKAFIAGAGGAAALPGVIASLTAVPVLGVPIETKSLKGLDSLLSIVQMPAGIPVATFAIGKSGAKNAALFAVALLSQASKTASGRLKRFRKKQAQAVKATRLSV